MWKNGIGRNKKHPNWPSQPIRYTKIKVGGVAQNRGREST